MKKILLGVGEPCWNREGTSLSLLRYDKKLGCVGVPIRPPDGFKGREQEYEIYAVPRRQPRKKAGRKA
jgi:hypothetical protein